MNQYQTFAHALHEYGCNVTTIASGTKRPGHSWKEYQETRQTLDDVNRLPWRDAAGVGVISGPGGVRVFDFDDCPDVAPALAVLEVLELPPTYPWLARSGSGAGWSITVRCPDDLPTGLLASNGKGPGVCIAPGNGFDHLELRYRDCLTVLPPSQHPTGPGYQWWNGAPTEPPAIVPVGEVIAAFRAVTVAQLTPQHTPQQPPAPMGYTDDHTAAAENLKRLAQWRCDDYKAWVDVGMALTQLGPAGLALWDAWSQGSNKYKPGECAAKWKTFDGHGLTLASLAYWAAQDSPRPRVRVAPDLAEPDDWPEHTPTEPPTPDDGAQPHPVPANNTTAGKAPGRRIKSVDLVQFLNQAGYTFRLNTGDDSIEVNGARITDVVRSEMRCKLRDRGWNKFLAAAEDAWTAEAGRRKFHPVRDYLTGLTWDGAEHIKHLAGYVTDAHGVFGLYLRKWLIGAVARAFTGTQNAVLVLDGKQGLGKSQLARWLCPLPDLFVDAGINPDDKDASLLAMRNWVWEVSELGATTKRTDVEALKGFLSREVFTLRPAYAHYDIAKPGLVSFIGTVNNSAGIFADPTGSRRYLTTTLTGLDWRYAADVDVKQVWAEAYAAYKHGEKWTLTADEGEAAREINATYAMPDPVEDLLRKHFQLDPADRTHWTSSADILTTLQNNGLGTNARSNSMALSATLKRLGFEKARSGFVNGYWGVWGKWETTG